MESSSPLSSHIRKPSQNIIVPIHDDDNNNMSLLDKYEIERISKELNHYIEASSEKKGHDLQIIRAKKSKGWLWFKHGTMMCTSRHDSVVEKSKGLRFITPKAFSELLKLLREYQNSDSDEGCRLLVDAEPTSSVEQCNESKVAEAFANFDRHSIASK
ncbi:hypothetical protein P3S68_030610 [Capsicum galapagoense]